MSGRRLAIDDSLLAQLDLAEGDVLQLALRPKRGTFDRALSALRELTARYAEEDEQRDLREEPMRGYWTLSRAGEVVAINLLDSQQPAVAVQDLARDLAGLGIDGRIVARERTDVEPLPARAYLLEARLHVGRGIERDGKLAWRTDPEAYLRVIRAAEEWCWAIDPAADLVFKPGLTDPFLLGSDDAPGKRAFDERAENPSFWVATETEVRLVAVNALASRVSLIALLPESDRVVGWRPVFDAIRAVIEVAAPDLAYAFIKHGSSVSHASLGWSLSSDWPARPGFRPQFREVFSVALQADRRAPDAFALQLLGPGYDLSSADFPSFESATVGRATIVEHRDPDGWFDSLFVPDVPGREPLAPASAPAILERAREELRSILLRPGEEQGVKIATGANGLADIGV